jgi:hypothetical protein
MRSVLLVVSFLMISYESGQKVRKINCPYALECCMTSRYTAALIGSLLAPLRTLELRANQIAVNFISHFPGQL